MYDNMKKLDPEVFSTVKKELGRQRASLEMIASENFVSKAVSGGFRKHHD
jgi:glycine hydroxymethyltransferase